MHRYKIINDPTINLCENVSSLDDTNPFLTYEYLLYRKETGSYPYLFLRENEEKVNLACYGFMKTGPISKSLDIPSFPKLSGDYDFWTMIMDFCIVNKIYKLAVYTFGSPKYVEIPKSEKEIRRKQRYEHLFDLDSQIIWNELSQNHQRNIKKAKNRKLNITIKKDHQSIEKHALLISQSMKRRSEKGEHIDFNMNLRPYIAMLECGLGEIWQCENHEKDVLSSIMLIKSKNGAYYQSAGTSQEGMKIGASHFLIFTVIESLWKQKKKLFNLGGVDNLDTGLNRFKSGFGTEIVKLESADLIIKDNLIINMLKFIRKIKKKVSKSLSHK